MTSLDFDTFVKKMHPIFERSKNVLSAVVVSRLIPADLMFDGVVDGRRYLAVSVDAQRIVAKQCQSSEYDIDYLSAVPFIHDDELALKVIKSALDLKDNYATQLLANYSGLSVPVQAVDTAQDA